MDLSQWASFGSAIVSAIGAVVTAIATVFLWKVTRVLAIETARMAEASAQPHIVATLVPNRWSIRHFDLEIENTGNATAYCIEVSFDPPLQNGEGRLGDKIPLQGVSLLKPAQCVSSYLTGFENLSGKVFNVRVQWRRSSVSSEVEINAYQLRMSDHDGVSRLGEDPLITIANRIKKIEEAWAPVAEGSKRTKVDVFTETGRVHERRVRERELRAMRARHAQATSPAPATDPTDDQSTSASSGVPQE